MLKVKYYILILALFLLALPMVSAINIAPGATESCTACANVGNINDENEATQTSNTGATNWDVTLTFTAANVSTMNIQNLTLSWNGFVAGPHDTSIYCNTTKVGSFQLPDNNKRIQNLTELNMRCSSVKLDVLAANTSEDIGFFELYLWNGTNATTPSLTPNITFSAVDSYDSSLINNYSISLARGSTIIYNASTNNGSISIFNITNGMANITFQSNQSGGYYEQRYNNVNVSGQTFTGQLYQAIATFNASVFITGTQILNFGATAPLQYNQSNSSGIAILYLKAGSYNFTANTTGYLNQTIGFTLSPFDDVRGMFNLSTNRLKIAAKDFLTNATVSAFNLTLTGVNVTYSSTQVVTNGNASFDVINGVYNATFTSPLYAWYSTLITVNTQLQNETLSVYPLNSFFISIYDLATNVLLQPNSILMQFVSPTNVFNTSTITGTKLLANITPEDYTITFSTTGYTTRDYLVTLLSGSNIVLNAYLQNSTSLSTITFTILDERTSQPIENALVAVTKRINLTYVTIDQEYTDIVGTSQFVLSQSEEYRFTISINGYTTRTFDLTPTSTTYTIYLSPDVVSSFETIYSFINFATYPLSNFITTSGVIAFYIQTAAHAGASINYFGVTANLNGTQLITNVSGSPGGGTATLNINLSQYSNTSIPITYFINVDGYTPFEINRTFYYQGANYGGNNTFSGALTYIHSNLSLLVQSLIALIIVLVAIVSFRSAGITGRAMNLVAGSVLGMLGYYQIIDRSLAYTGMVLLFAMFFLMKRDET